MKSIFDKNNFEELKTRLQEINSSSTPGWGKMNVAQMLHHLNITIEAPLGKIETKGKPIFFMKLFKGVLYNDKPFGKGHHTPNDFKTTGLFVVEKEKQKCLSNLTDVYSRNINGNYLPHIVYGKITNEQWGLYFYKHADHHFRQFGE